MATIKSYLDKGDEIIDNAELAVLDSVDEAERAIFKEVIKIFSEADTSSGKFVKSEKARRFLMGLDVRITDALYNSKYRLGVSSLLKDYDKIVQNNIDIQDKLNQVNITQKSLRDIQSLEVENTVDRFLGTGLNKDFVNPLRQTIYRNVMLGGSVEETKAAIEAYILSTGDKESVLKKYVGQVARDSVMQFDGSIQQSIASELDLPDYIYTGSIILDSRDQCVYWAGKGDLKGEDLEEEIADAKAGESLTGLKPCSGMNPSCELNTFSIFRGGYRCRHRAIVTLL